MDIEENKKPFGKPSFADDGGKEPECDVQEGHISDVTSALDEDGEMPRTFSPRQMQVINVGGTVGSGLFIGTGLVLADGGPGNMVIGYVIVCSCVWAILQVVSEMTIAFPTSGNFIDYADRFADPALGFAIGFAEWLGWTAVVGSEAVMWNTICNYWAKGSVPEGAYFTIMLVFLAILMFLPNKWFSWFEYLTSIMKIVGLIVIIFVCFAMVLGAGPTGHVHRGQEWTDYPIFKNGFAGFSNGILYAVWAIGDNVMPGIMAGEAKSPRYSMARAAKIVPFRVSTIYLIPIVFITVLVPSDDDRLFGASGAAASPFVIAANDAGIKGLPDFLNVIILVGITAIAAESIYIASRILRAMAHQRLLPGFVANVGKTGQPLWAIAITTAIGVMLTYMNLSATGIVVFNWLGSITSAAYFVVWIIICISSWRFRKALKAQNDPLFSEVYAYQTWMWPLPAVWLLCCCTLLLVCCVYRGLFTVGSSHPNVYNFFEYMIGVLLIAFSYIGYKLLFRTKLRDPMTVDLQTGRRRLTEEEITFLRDYYAQPLWRRFTSYFQIW